MLIRVAVRALRNGMGEEVGIQGMMHFEMAHRAIDLVIGDVRLVQKRTVLITFQVIRPVMADGTAFLRYFALTANQVTVAALAQSTPCSYARLW